MSKKYVLIMGSPVDDQAMAVFMHLKSINQPVDFIDSLDFPSKLSISLEMPENKYYIKLMNGKVINQDDVLSIYWRNFNGIFKSQSTNQKIASNDTRSFFESFLRSNNFRWVNGYAGFYKHQNKPFALQLVSKLSNVKIPKTLITNDPELLVDFANSTEDCIFKPVQGGAHTQLVTSKHLSDENLKSLKDSPVCLQEYIKRINIRIFVAGDYVEACSIDASSLDFRDDRNSKIAPFKLNEDQRKMALDICRVLDLSWSGIDFRMNDKEELVYLEANPSPMFIGFQKQSGLPLIEALVSLLTES